MESLIDDEKLVRVTHKRAVLVFVRQKVLTSIVADGAHLIHLVRNCCQKISYKKHLSFLRRSHTRVFARKLARDRVSPIGQLLLPPIGSQQILFCSRSNNPLAWTAIEGPLAFFGECVLARKRCGMETCVLHSLTENQCTLCTHHDRGSHAVHIGSIRTRADSSPPSPKFTQCSTKLA